MADLNDRTQDVSLHDDVDDVAVTTTPDGLKRRLDVSTTESPATNYQLDAFYNAVGVSVGTTDVSLYSFTGSGVIDFIAVGDATSSAYEVVIKIDGTERHRITMSDLGSNLGLSDSSSPMWAATANKQFRYRPDNIGFATSFEVLARATTGTRTLTWMVLFKEQVG